MIDTKRITLTKQLRTRILMNVMYAWERENPKPAGSFSDNPDMKKLFAHRDKARTFRDQIEDALSTFRNLHQLQHEWPEMMKFVPEAILHPQRIKLPKLLEE